MKNFRTLNLAIEFYKEAKNLKFEAPAADQFQRALLSIPLNLSEGSAKTTARDRARFYAIALGSLREVQTLLNLANQEELGKKADQLGAMMFRLIQNPGSAPVCQSP